MDSIINKLYFSEKAKQILTNEKTKNRIYLFMRACAKTHKENESNFTCKTRLDAHLLYTASASACIDLYSSNHIHDMKNDNPSPSKKGASIASWFNRLKPIQIIEGNDNGDYVFLNAFIALSVGLEIKWKEEGKSIVNTNETIHENNNINNLLYVFMWRNPSYKDLTTIFELL